jgi:hypothetical protein
MTVTVTLRAFRDWESAHLPIRHILPPYGERGQQPEEGRRGGSAGRGGRGWMKGESLVVVDVASGTEEAKAA